MNDYQLYSYMIYIFLYNTIFFDKKHLVVYSRMSSPATPATLTPKPITINLNVVIDASGNLEVLNAPAPSVQNVIVAEQVISTTALYDPNNSVGLLELWEPSEAQGDIKVQLADTNRVLPQDFNPYYVIVLTVAVHPHSILLSI